MDVASVIPTMLCTRCDYCMTTRLRFRAESSRPMSANLQEDGESRASCFAEMALPTEGIDGDSSSDEDRPQQLQDELLLLLSSRRPRGWTAASARLCQQGALVRGKVGVGVAPASDFLSAGGFDFHRAVSEVGGHSFAATFGRAGRCWTGSAGMPTQPATVVPIAPLELDFISGPRMGEKLVLCERICTLGRGEGNTIQVSDSQLASVSRVHCIFEYCGDRWQMRDNGSTNGTWRRLSCVLEPSAPVPLVDGLSIQAGAHEFLVEEAEMRHWWIPSAARASFEDLHERERREHNASSQQR